MSVMEQTEIPGTERTVIEAVEKAAKEYVTIRDSRMELTKQEVAKKTILLHEMHEHGLTNYSFDGCVVKIEPGKEKLTVRAVDEDESDWDDGDGEKD